MSIRKMTLVGLVACTPIAAAAAPVKTVPGEFVVKLKTEKVDQSTFSSLHVKSARKLNVSFGNFRVFKLTNKKGMSTRERLEKLNSHPAVEYAEPNYIYELIEPVKTSLVDDILNTDFNTPYRAPNDPRFSELWGMKNTGDNDPDADRGKVGADIDALKAWSLHKGSRNVKIAVIDTGIDYNHPDIRENMWVNEAELNGEEGVDDDGNGYVDDVYGYDFSNDDGDPLDGHSHGTHCSGTIGAVHNNDIGVAGVMDNVQFVGIKFLSDYGSGSTADAIESIDYARKVGVDIMSNSWGGGAYSQALEEAIQKASDAGIVFVAAAGNSSSDNDNSPHYPSNYEVENIISVASTNAEDQLSSFSSYGGDTVHLAAPGSNILSTTKDGGYDVYSGTSMATPHVSGAIGLLLAHEGDLSMSEIKERLMATSEPLPELRRKTISGGRLNAYNLLKNKRPQRDRPDPEKWETIALDEVWESEHPYPIDFSDERTYRVEGAEYIRVVISKYDLEPRYDFLAVENSKGRVIEKISKKGEDYVSEYVMGDTLNMKFSSDRSINSWGFIIKEIQVQ